jgi:hypothetical protein
MLVTDKTAESYSQGEQETPCSATGTVYSLELCRFPKITIH